MSNYYCDHGGYNMGADCSKCQEERVLYRAERRKASRDRMIAAAEGAYLKTGMMAAAIDAAVAVQRLP